MEAALAEWMYETMEWIRQSGWLGWFWFILVYAFTCVFFLPGSFLTIGAGAVYGFWGGTVLVTASSAAGAAVNFLTSRYLARRWVERHLGQTKKFHALENAIGKEGWPIVMLSRISPIVPHSLVSYASGLTRISFGRYILVSTIGFIPLSAAYAYAGAVVGRLARTQAGVSEHDPVTWTLYIIGLIVTVIVAVWSTRAATKAFADADAKIAPAETALSPSNTTLETPLPENPTRGE